MSFSNSPVLMVEYRWSWQRWTLVAIQLAVCLSIPWLIPSWPSGLTSGLRTAASAMSVLILCVGYQRLGWWGRRRLHKASLLQSGQWLLERVDGSNCSAELLGSSRIGSYFMCLRLRSDETSKSVWDTSHYRLMFIRGELNLDAWRQLQARLRLAAGRNMPTDLVGQK